MAASEETAWQKKVETTKMSGEELGKMGLQGAKRPPGQKPGSFLHQTGAKGATAYPFALAGIFVLAAVGTAAYYSSSSSSPSPQKQQQQHH